MKRRQGAQASEPDCPPELQTRGPACHLSKLVSSSAGWGGDRRLPHRVSAGAKQSQGSGRHPNQNRKVTPFHTLRKAKRKKDKDTDKEGSGIGVVTSEIRLAKAGRGEDVHVPCPVQRQAQEPFTRLQPRLPR